MLNSDVKEQQTAIVVNVFSRENDDDAFTEFLELVSSSNISVVAQVTSTRQNPDSKFYIGSGKADEVAEVIKLYEPDVVIVNHDLTPGQERNLERHISCRVISRVGLILDIFAQRASSHAGKLQVELAQLQHLSTRLVRGWTHLERQKGGIGLRGPGETQLETDRRLLGERIKTINARLSKVHKQREQGRQQRKRNEIPVVSMVGYTNAGKSTLFNRLSNSGVYAANQLFATLDPTHRRLELNGADPIILTDTVGFIRDLPHELVESFKATLDEVREADLLLHVIDVYADNREFIRDEVNTVIEQIGAADVPQIEVYNKIDLHSDIETKVEYASEDHQTAKIWVSAVTGEGMDTLTELIQRTLQSGVESHDLIIPASEGRFRSMLFEMGTVREEECLDNGDWKIQVDIQGKRLHKLVNEANKPIIDLH